MILYISIESIYIEPSDQSLRNRMDALVGCLAGVYQNIQKSAPPVRLLKKREFSLAKRGQQYFQATLCLKRRCSRQVILKGR
jgi:hypothetical protein